MNFVHLKFLATMAAGESSNQQWLSKFHATCTPSVALELLRDRETTAYAITLLDRAIASLQSRRQSTSNSNATWVDTHAISGAIGDLMEVRRALVPVTSVIT